MKKIAVLALLTLLACANTAFGRDLYIGTLEIRDGMPMLIRCSTGKPIFLLVNKEGDSSEYVKRIEALGASASKPYQAQVFGDARMEGEMLILTVDSVKNVNPGSCHLDALF
jgi:hypothetical protein